MSNRKPLDSYIRRAFNRADAAKMNELLRAGEQHIAKRGGIQWIGYADRYDADFIYDNRICRGETYFLARRGKQDEEILACASIVPYAKMTEEELEPFRKFPCFDELVNTWQAGRWANPENHVGEPLPEQARFDATGRWVLDPYCVYHFAAKPGSPVNSGKKLLQGVIWGPGRDMPVYANWQELEYKYSHGSVLFGNVVTNETTERLVKYYERLGGKIVETVSLVEDESRNCDLQGLLGKLSLVTYVP